MYYLSPVQPTAYVGDRPVVLTSEPAPPPQPLCAFTVKCSQLSASLMSQLSFSGLVGGTVQANAQFFLLQFAFAGTRLVPSLQDPSVLVQWGSAFRVGIKSINTSGKVTANIAELAASTTLSAVSTSTSVQYMGFSEQLIQKLPTFQANQPFDSAMLNSIGQLLAVLQAQVAQNPGYIQPTLLEYQRYVSAEGKADVTDFQGISAAYALHAMMKGKSLGDALSNLQDKVSSGNDAYSYALVDPLLVRATYYQATGGNPDVSPLSNAAKTAAHQITGSTNI